ncbi:3-oxoacyl-[acyl-carrier-protein] reductase [Parachlamydia sp. AcF125]|uniref:3-oxoacyl-[acyl-carrier-protein] reductase n=1 Tax=Parachlamydia sp. AcF125 TaxID=2795736 RepID=UPI001BC9CA26|nr:3-oxoacyl-[acyl-carrier-protein] reductase [Parachlamydia sp. AcF125]MBS4169187.1 3-oxoacyl-[acyl-carrier-protein] reductase FabG [Parachlamydia sp. AcF125]
MIALPHASIALVTGGNAGIGKAIAQQLAQAGATVIIFGTNRERGLAAVDEINALTERQSALFFQVNVSNTGEVDQAIQNVLGQFGHIDILVNNAGITRDNLLMKMSEADWDEVMDTNVKSCYNLCKSLARTMVKARKGKIINISSVIGLTGNAGQVNYASSKAALIGFTKALAKELAPRNICVNCIAPGFIETRMTDVMTEPQRKAILDTIPLGRMGTPDDIAQAALYLASPASNYMTGQVLVIDGGMVM